MEEDEGDPFPYFRDELLAAKKKMDRRRFWRNATIVTGLAALASVTTCSIAMSQERQYPNLRGYQANLQFITELGGTKMGIYFDTNNDGWANIVYIYNIISKEGKDLHLTEPIGMMIDEDRNGIFDKNEYHSFNKKKLDGS